MGTPIIRSNMIVADLFENATPFQLDLHKTKTDENLFVKESLLGLLYRCTIYK